MRGINGIMPSEMILISPSFSPWQLVLLGQLEAEGARENWSGVKSFVSEEFPAEGELDAVPSKNVCCIIMAKPADTLKILTKR
jgi:hypothetical protein